MKPLSLDLEKNYADQGRVVIGVDEAGRGALAGPVVASAVILQHNSTLHPLLQDSKRLTAEQRVVVFDWVHETAVAISVGVVDNHTIDDINILQATYAAMHLAIDSLKYPGVLQTHLLIDGNRFRPHSIEHTCLVKGDSFVPSIAAASVVAKVTRDREMMGVQEALYPEYGFKRHKGYGTKRHREAISTLGTCNIHRKSFLSKIIPVQLGIEVNAD